MKKILGIILIVAMIFCFTGCNMKLLDTDYHFNYAYITMPDGSVIEVNVNKWVEDSNSITIESDAGQVYSVSYHNCLMTKNKWEK